MTTLAITPNWKNKTAKFKGTIAAGEHVAVSISNDDGYVSDASTLRLRVVDPTNGKTLAQFPMPEEDGEDEVLPSSETPAEGEVDWASDLTPLYCILNLNTVQMLKAVPPAANVPLLFVLDDYDNKTLYFKEQFEVTHWPRRFGEEEPAPTDLDDYKDIIEDFNTRLTAAEQTVATAATNAQSAANSASAAAASAATAATAATNAQTGAIASKNAAQTAANDAVSAKTAAEDAQDAAKNAQEAAETAQGKAQGYAEAAARSAAAFVVDDTLSVEGAAADAKAVGEANQDLTTQIGTVQDNLDAETKARETLDGAVQADRQNLANEIARAQGAEQDLESRKADKSTTYTKIEVDTKIAGVQAFQKYLVDELPDADEADIKGLYLVPTGETSEEGDLCEEWTVVEKNGVKRWEKIGAKSVDLTLDDTVTKGSTNGVKSSGIWSAIWGALAALPTGFSSLYDWCVSQLAGKASTVDATLTEQFTPWVVSGLPDDALNVSVTSEYDESLGRWVWTLFWAKRGTTPYTLLAVTQTDDITFLRFDNAITATRRTVLQLGEQSDKPIQPAGNYLPKDEVVAPSTSASDSGKAADAKATGDALAGKLDKSGGEMTPTFAAPAIPPGKVVFGADAAGPYIGIAHGQNVVMLRPSRIELDGRKVALAALNPTAGNLAALDANGNPTDSGIAAGDLLTIVALTNSAETMASILTRLNAINAAHKHVFFDCSGIDVNPRLYLCTIMIDADANAVRVYDQVTGKLYIGPYDATETIGEVFAKAVDAYHSITVSAVTLDDVTVTGQTVTIREGTDATAPVYATATITDGAPVVFVVPKGMIYFLEITDALADHFGPRVTSGAKQGIATADAAVTFTYYDAEHIDVSEITTFAKLQEALTWFGTNEAAARNNLVGIEIADTWTATNGTVYDNPRVVWDVHYFEDENGVSHLGALMGTKYCSYNDVQFDAAEGEECDSSTETVAEAGVYYYGLALGQTSKTAANLTLLELSEGDALPYADYAKIYKSAIRDTTRNSLQYGYDNWRDSAYRQYLNSDAAAGQWWGATHIGDVAPSQLNSVRGFMAGCSTALLAAAKKVKVATWPNYITDGPNQITTLYETLDTFFLPSGSEVYGDVNRNGGASVEGELSPYWQARTGYTAPNNASTSTRIIYRELPVGSTANRSAATVRLRSASRGYSYSVWFVNTSGQVSNYYANVAYASVPACVIY